MSDQKTILVADDEAHILAVVSMKLRNGGFTVLTAKDGAEALEIATRERVDLLITDYHMPHYNGLELCRELRSRGKAIKAIMLTARGYNLEPSDTEDTGICRMMSKPFSPRQLLGCVNNLLGLSEDSGDIGLEAA